MADKKGFCMFCDWIDDLSYLDDKSFRQIIEALCAYTENNINPVELVNNQLKPIVSMMFHQIKRQEESSQKRAEAGKKGGEAKEKDNNTKAKVSKSKQSEAKVSKSKQSEAKVSKSKQSEATITITDTITDTITLPLHCFSPSDEGENNAPARTHAREDDQCDQADQKDGKTPYGEFCNVYLTEDERSALDGRYGASVASALIDNLSRRIKAKGYQYEDHYATILDWAAKDGVKTSSEKSYDAEEFFMAAVQRSYDERK